MVLSRIRLALLAGRVFLGLGGVSAQKKGQWVPGQSGLNAGILPNPGTSYANLTIDYSASTLKDAKANAIPLTGACSFWVAENVVYYVPKVKVLGGKLTFQILMPVANGSLTAPAFGIDAGGAGYADTWVQPMTLGWNLKRASTWVGYAFSAPTGRFIPGLTTNVGSGYWGYNLVSGTTLYLTKEKKTTANLAIDWEIHGKKSGTNETPGQLFTTGWGVGQLFPLDNTMTKLLQLGLLGYDQWQVTADGRTIGNALPPNLIPFYSVHAVGVQTNCLLPAKNASLFFKFESEYLAFSHPQGRTIVFGGSWTWPLPRARRNEAQVP
jgi:hypothetical protein